VMLRIATVSDLLSYFAVCQEIAGTLICFVYFWLKLTQSQRQNGLTLNRSPGVHLDPTQV